MCIHTGGRASWPGPGDEDRRPITCVHEQWKDWVLCVYHGIWTKGLTLCSSSVLGICYTGGLGCSQGLYLTFFFSIMCLYTGSLLSSPTAPGCLQHQMSSCQRQSKSDKHTGWTSEENLAACSSAISARESSYKKHLLHFVLSMMLWKINTGMVCFPLLSLSLCESLRPFVCMLMHMHLVACLYLCFGEYMSLCVRMCGCMHVILARVSGDKCIIICISQLVLGLLPFTAFKLFIPLG